MTEELKTPVLERYQALVDSIRGLEGVAVAFSGGVDSTFLLKAAVEALGDRTLAITIATSVQPQWELDLAGEMARELGARWEVVRADVLALPAFVENGPERCYHCKRFLFGKALELARRHGIEVLLDGSNVDDLGDYRPGAQAARELGVRSPLRDLGFCKEHIREASRALGLKTHDLPSFACLASRIPYGTQITLADLRLVERGESYLRELGFRQNRVRHYGDTARIEVEPRRICDLAALAREVDAFFRELGYKYVCMDLHGFATGSMNAAIGKDRKGE
jgi:uncharacterized protein